MSTFTTFFVKAYISVPPYKYLKLYFQLNNITFFTQDLTEVELNSIMNMLNAEKYGEVYSLKSESNIYLTKDSYKILIGPAGINLIFMLTEDLKNTFIDMFYTINE